MSNSNSMKNENYYYTNYHSHLIHRSIDDLLFPFFLHDWIRHFFFLKRLPIDTQHDRDLLNTKWITSNYKAKIRLVYYLSIAAHSHQSTYAYLLLQPERERAYRTSTPTHIWIWMRLCVEKHLKKYAVWHWYGTSLTYGSKCS